jgi:cyclophilin family peptidyl-prolyl cis-trans isomerase
LRVARRRGAAATSSIVRRVTRLLPVLLASLVLTTAACGSSDDEKDTSTKAPATTTAQATNTDADTGAAAAPAAGKCKDVKAQEPVQRTAKKPTTTLSAAKTYVVTMTTSCGDIEITLDVKGNPKTASSFASLVKGGFYDGLGVVRVVPDFVLQAGDPDGVGTGGPGYSVVEAPSDNTAYRKGIVAMAKTGAEAPGTSGSQFFIVTGADAGLPPEYAVAGKVTKGIEVAEAIGAITPVDPSGQPAADGAPSQPVLIEKATLSER